MVELLVVVLVALAYALGRSARRAGSAAAAAVRAVVRLVVAASALAAGRGAAGDRAAIWRQTAAVQRAARQAMRDVVARLAEDEGSGAPDTAAQRCHA